MDSFSSFIRHPLIRLLLFSTLAFASGFGLAYRQDRIRAEEIGRLTWSHFSYAEELKDDMAVIDWSNDMKNLDGLRVFQADLNSKVIAEGGNRAFLPGPTPEGIGYRFPADWAYHVRSSGDAQGVKEFLLVYHSGPGPWLWGLLCFSTALLSGLGMSLQGGDFKTASVKMPISSFTAKGAGPALDPNPPAGPSTDDKAFLFINKSYVILQATARAAALLGKNLDALEKVHLLDLAPDPAFIQAIEKGKEAELFKPFSSHPHLSVLLKPDPNGCWLFLESEGPSKSP